MFLLDRQGKCETCLQKSKESDIIQCYVCELNYHALCDNVDGNTDGIVTKTHLGQHKKASTRPNFIWNDLVLSEPSYISSTIFLSGPTEFHLDAVLSR